MEQPGSSSSGPAVPALAAAVSAFPGVVVATILVVVTLFAGRCRRNSDAAYRATGFERQDLVVSAARPVLLVVLSDSSRER